MGEMADAVLDGAFCQICGEYLGEGDGYPRSCGGCGGGPSIPRTKADKKRRKRQRRSVASARKAGDAQSFIAEIGFKQMGNPWHYQLRLPGCPALDYWPSRSKWCVRSVVHRGDEAALRKFINDLRAQARPEALASP